MVECATVTRMDARSHFFRRRDHSPGRGEEPVSGSAVGPSEVLFTAVTVGKEKEKWRCKRNNDSNLCMCSLCLSLGNLQFAPAMVQVGYSTTVTGM